MTQPTTFSLPVSRFDLNLLPPDARQIGTDRFKDAVLLHFTKEYLSNGQQVVVSVDDQTITVVAFDPQEQHPLDAILAMLNAGRIAEAVPLLEALAKVAPENVEALYNLGIAYSELGQFDEAVIRLKRAVQLQPDHSRAWTGIGVAYQRMGKHESAMEALQHAVQADPSDGYGHRNLAAMLASAGRLSEALTHMRVARNALPTDQQAAFGLAMVLERLGGVDQRSEADELYQMIIAKWPGSRFAEMAREARTKLAGDTMRAAVGGGLRPDAVMYLTGALDRFEKMTPAEIQALTMEIALKGQEGLDINDPEQKYALKSLPGRFSGMNLVCMMYAAFKRIAPQVDSGIDLSKEYEAAVAMRGK
jgi:Flp pilus assembly protein TadD